MKAELPLPTFLLPNNRKHSGGPRQLHTPTRVSAPARPSTPRPACKDKRTTRQWSAHSTLNQAKTCRNSPWVRNVPSPHRLSVLAAGHGSSQLTDHCSDLGPLPLPHGRVVGPDPFCQEAGSPHPTPLRPCSAPPAPRGSRQDGAEPVLRCAWWRETAW